MTEPGQQAPRLDRLWMHEATTRAVVAALEAAGGPGCARFVGGCVRDALLDRERPDLDIDIATMLTPPQVVAALEAQGLKAVPTGIEHGTVTAVAKGRPFEITTLRRDVQTDGRHAVVAFSTDWAQDAARRDFRLNALYMDPAGTLHDPTGGGVADALAGRIVFVGDPDTRIAEDYLRVLRFFRFLAGYGRGEPDAAALAACARSTAGLAGLSGERVAKELLKLLAAPDPRAAVGLMADTGVLGVLLPGVASLTRFARLVEIEPGADSALRLAALLPDDRAQVTVAAKRLRLSNLLRDRLLAACADQTEVSTHMSPSAARAAIYKLGPQTFADRVRLAWAAQSGGGRPDSLDLAQAWTPPPFPVTGEEIKAAGAPEGPAVGRLRREIEAWWIARDFAPTKADALRHLVSLIGRTSLRP